MYANHTKKCSICLHVFTSTAQEHMKHCGLQYCLSCSKEVNQFYNRGAAFNPSHMKRKREEKMKKNNTSCSFILTLKRNKIPEITSLIWCAQKTIHNLPSKVKIAYNNMISLYPCANPECEYPIGHPEFIDQTGTIDISKYYGLVKCKILPPYELYHPVLPYRYDSKLLFPPCRTCAQQQIKQQPTNNKRSEKCPHSAEERSLTGTWTTFELQKAIEKDYVIAYIYEIWHFKERSNQLFQPYI